MPRMQHMYLMPTAISCYFLSLLSVTAFSQNTPQTLPHIKVVLVGTFHFGNTPDKGKINFEDLFTVKRQHELQGLTTQLAQLRPDKVFVENQPDQQVRWDSLFTLYQAGKLDTTSLRDEIFQVGMRTAQKAGLTQVICVDHHSGRSYF